MCEQYAKKLSTLTDDRPEDFARVKTLTGLAKCRRRRLKGLAMSGKVSFFTKDFYTFPPVLSLAILDPYEWGAGAVGVGATAALSIFLAVKFLPAL